MPRFTINCHGVQNADDVVQMKFPLNTYTTDDPEKALDCLRKLFSNSQSGINRVVILDRNFGDLPEARVGMAPMDLDEPSYPK